MEATARDILRLYAHHVRRYWFLATLVFTGIIGANVAEIFAPIFYKKFFDLLSISTPSQDAYLPLLHTLFFVVAIHGTNWVCYRVASAAADTLQPRVMADLEQTAFRGLMKHSYAFFSSAFTGALVRRVNRLSRAFEVMSESVQWRLIPVIVTTVGVLCVLWQTQPLLSLIMLGWSLAFILVNYAFSRWKLKYDVIRAQRDSEATAVLSDAVSNAVTVKLFSGLSHEDRLFAGATNALRAIRTLSARLLELNTALQAAFMIGVEFLVTWLALKAWAAGSITLGDFALIQGALINLFNKLWDFGRVIRDIYESFADAQEMATVLKTPYEITDRVDAKTMQVEQGEILFENVSFGYSPQRRVLRDFDLHIQPKEKIALVGPSGAGKSTVMKLLLRLYDIDGGTIRIDGQSITDVTQDSLREAIAVVPQEPILFHRSLLENIRYGRRDATDEEVIEAAKQAHCHEFISTLSQGYNTPVGERGVKLSGGERQRVAVARAILKNAPILLLDEATSALDSESESLIQDALKDLMEDKTVIVVAHRLSTILQMDRIIVVEHGGVSAQGTHKQLLTRSKTYKKLWKIQAGGFIP